MKRNSGMVLESITDLFTDLFRVLCWNSFKACFKACLFLSFLSGGLYPVASVYCSLPLSHLSVTPKPR